jgi:hypothetical protein
MKNILSFLLFITLSQSVLAKRMAPKKIEDIFTKRGVIHYEFQHTASGFISYIIMKDKAGDIKWKTKIFSRQYTKNLETDVQDIFLKTMIIEDYKVIAVDEMGRKYNIDLDSGELLKPLRQVNY